MTVTEALKSINERLSGRDNSGGIEGNVGPTPFDDSPLRSIPAMPSRFLISSAEMDMRNAYASAIAQMQEQRFHPAAFALEWPLLELAHPPAPAPPQPPATPPPLMPIAEPEAVDAELLQHAALARKLGVVVSAPAGAAQLQAVLREEGFSCYDRAAVEKYMTELAEANVKNWIWYAARSADSRKFDHTRGQWGLHNGTSVSEVYTEAIPLPVLITMDRIIERMGADVRFQIAALCDAPKADPFLAVSHVSEPSKMFIIERWDEPGFRGVSVSA